MRRKWNVFVRYSIGMFGVGTEMHTHTHGEILWWVMFWGCFNYRGPGALVRIDGIMNSTKYQGILADNLVPSARRLGLGRRWTFQQDNDQKHSSRSIQKWFCDNKINVLKRSVGQHKPKNLKDLDRICQEVWSKISPNVFLMLVRNYRKRLQAVFLARGGCTKY